MDILEFSLPRFNELPKVPLYKDQVITYLDNLSKVLNIKNTEKVLTPTMINSYVKQKIVSPPKDKKYNEKHLAYLIVVCVLKQVFSIQEISTLINMQIEHCPIEAVMPRLIFFQIQKRAHNQHHQKQQHEDAQKAAQPTYRQQPQPCKRSKAACSSAKHSRNNCSDRRNNTNYHIYHLFEKIQIWSYYTPLRRDKQVQIYRKHWKLALHLGIIKNN
jgi:hypothetical protein